MFRNNRIRNIRLLKGMTQRTLANENYSSSYLSKIETGKSEVTDDLVNYLANKMDIPTWLIDEEDFISRIEEISQVIYSYKKTKTLTQHELLLLHLCLAQGDLKGLSLSIYTILIEYYYDHDYPSTQKIIKQAASVLSYEEEDDPERWIDYLMACSKYYYRKDDFYRTLKCYMEINHILGDIRTVRKGKILYNIGLTLNRTNSDSEPYLQEALQIFQELHLTNDVIDTLIILGIKYNRSNRSRHALETYNYILNLLKDTDNPELLATIEANIGNVYQSMNKFELAIEHLNKSLIYLSKNESVPVLESLITIYLEMGNVFKAKEYLERALTIVECDVHTYDHITIEFLEAKIYLLEGGEEEYLLQMNRLNKLVKKNKYVDIQIDLNLHLAEYCYKGKKFEKSALLFREANYLLMETQKKKVGNLSI